MITLRDIEKKTMTKAKREEACNSYFAFFIGRPLSYIFTIPFLYTNISPNTVTFFSILFAIIGFICISISNSLMYRLIGFLFFFLWNMGDGVDGNIARYKGLKSSNGDLLDTLGGYVSLSLILLAMGNASYNDTKGNIYFIKELPIFLAEISAVSTLLPRLLMHRKLANNKNSDAIKLKEKSSYTFSKIVVLNICDPAGFQQVFVLIALVMHLCAEFTIVYFVINLIVMVYSIKQLLD